MQSTSPKMFKRFEEQNSSSNERILRVCLKVLQWKESFQILSSLQSHERCNFTRFSLSSDA